MITLDDIKASFVKELKTHLNESERNELDALNAIIDTIGTDNIGQPDEVLQALCERRMELINKALTAGKSVSE